MYFWFFFHKNIWNYTYICTICNDNLKFTLSLKLDGLMPFIAVPPNACLFSITRFLYGWQKIFTNKNIFSIHDLHVLFISFFSKMYNKKLLFILGRSPGEEWVTGNRAYDCGCNSRSPLRDAVSSLRKELIRLWNSILPAPGQPSAQLSKLVRLTACKKTNHTVSRWYRTVYIPWLVASYDTHKGKRWLNSDPAKPQGGNIVDMCQ